MKRSRRNILVNRAVLLLFGLPALGYAGFLSQFVFGEPTGFTRWVLGGLLLFTYPVMALYSTVLNWTLWLLGETHEGLGTAGFFVFAYGLAVAFVWCARQGKTAVS